MGLLISHSPEETESIGRCWGDEAAQGWLVLLRGDLGAGKTQLVKGIARGLGIESRVHSPTFSLINIYTGGRFALFHLDLYRLNGREEIIGAGLEEYLRTDGVTVIEWAERWFGELSPGASVPAEIPRPFRWATLEHLNENERRISYEDFGA
jgi:tRNA threonylcarbamoyladenosine biosynthesis protein TsaE